MEHADYEVGRLIEAVEKMGELDNTLMLYIIGDNGCSAEGTLLGTFNEVHTLKGYQERLEDLLPHIEDWGKPGSSPHMAVGWAWAGDTPFQWTEMVASHLGGTHNPIVISWLKRIADKGGIRSQFHHVIDIAPTILEVVGITEPAMGKRRAAETDTRR